MGDLIAWALIIGVIVLYIKRGSVAVLVGTVLAVITSGIKITAALAVVGLALNRAGGGSSGGPGFTRLAEWCAAVVFAAVAVSAVLLWRGLFLGRIWPRGW